ncbi:HNH endonuclease [Actinoplanes sp. NPDC051470]|uniref:HNH endonuclease n=1 Tax=Actinoplanes sp. NPDC051470 TaxID=3157224 RepID=UPI0034345261
MFSTCSICRTLTPYGVSRCPTHKPRRHHVKTRQQRGYTEEYLTNRRIILKDDPICSICLRRKATTADHIVPLSKGGTNKLNNLRPACLPCNSGRGNRT